MVLNTMNVLIYSLRVIDRIYPFAKNVVMAIPLYLVVLPNSCEPELFLNSVVLTLLSSLHFLS